MAPSDRPSPGPPARLILGTAFYRTPAINYEDEQAVYRSLAAELGRRGDAPILYKEHPRATRPPLLTPEDGVEVVQSRMPVEIWAEARTILEAYSISSTALLSLRRFYGARTWTVGAEIAFPAAMRHIRLMRDAVTPFEP